MEEIELGQPKAINRCPEKENGQDVELSIKPDESRNPYAYYDHDGHLIVGMLRLTYEQAEQISLNENSAGVTLNRGDAFPVCFTGNKDLLIKEALDLINK